MEVLGDVGDDAQQLGGAVLPALEAARLQFERERAPDQGHHRFVQRRVAVGVERLGLAQHRDQRRDRDLRRAALAQPGAGQHRQRGQPAGAGGARDIEQQHARPLVELERVLARLVDQGPAAFAQGRVARSLVHPAAAGEQPQHLHQLAVGRADVRLAAGQPRRVHAQLGDGLTAQPADDRAALERLRVGDAALERQDELAEPGLPVPARRERELDLAAWRRARAPSDTGCVAGGGRRGGARNQMEVLGHS